MGTTQSKTVAERHAEIGPFMLDSKQKAAIGILSKIVQQLLTKNNLFDLKDLLSTEKSCGDLFVIVSTTVQKEFQLLKFPDPRNPSHMATLSFLPKSSYPPEYPDSVAARDSACNAIAHFLIRLITLAAACTASISRNPNVAELLDIARTESPAGDINKYIRNLPSDLSFSNSSLSNEVLAYLAPIFSQVDAVKRPNLYRYKTTYTYIIDAKRSVIYNASGTYDEGRTPVFKISMDLLKDKYALSNILPSSSSSGLGSYAQLSALLGSSGSQSSSGLSSGSSTSSSASVVPSISGSSGASVAPAAAAAAAMPPSNRSNQKPINSVKNIIEQRMMGPGSIATSAAPSGAPSALGSRIGGRFKSRRSRMLRKKQTRRRLQRGGNEKVSFVKVNIEEVIYSKYTDCEDRGRCERLEFILDNTGNTYDVASFEEFQRNPTRPIPESAKKEFIDRILMIFDKIKQHRIMTTEYRERTELSKEQFKPLTGATAETLKTLEDYRDTMPALKTGAAPAPYRAFMLASRMAGGALSTFFCQDEWSGQYVIATLSYSLLQALYDDGVAGTIASPRTLDACKAAAKAFIGAQVAAPAAQSGSDVENFRNLRFAATPTALAEFCKTSRPQRTEKQSEQEILIRAQRDIRELYDNHIRDIVSIMRKVIFVTTDPSSPGSLILNLNEIFSKSADGGLVVLERIIEEARNTIAKHYLEVEKKYVGALISIGRGYHGINDSAIASEITTNKLGQLGSI